MAPEFAPQAGDIVIKEHWGSSGFANTDLDLQLGQRGIIKVIMIGLMANTCIETTSRFASELGYHVTLVKDATAAFSREIMRTAHELNGPTFAHPRADRSASGCEIDRVEDGPRQIAMGDRHDPALAVDPDVAEVIAASKTLR